MAVVVSAPGKVLLTGAYLVLERPNPGLVLSTSARFFAIVKPLHSVVDENSWAWSWTDVSIRSPQLSKEAIYKLSLRNFTLQKISPISEEGNAFAEMALQLAVVAASITHQNTEKDNDFKKTLLQGLEITILGSNDFYSYRKHIEAKGLPLASSTLASLPCFAPITFNVVDSSDTHSMLPQVAKTGLGSSAAMTTAIVASVLEYFGVTQIPHRSIKSWQLQLKSLDVVHSLAQAAHSMAQGKIGSGFDVSTAVYGSQQYVRFSPSILQSVQEGNKVMPVTEVVRNLLNENWDAERQEYALPPLLALVLGEPGFGGSHTPSMVGEIQKWRKLQLDKAKLLWSELGQANMDVKEGLLQLKNFAKCHENEYMLTLKSCENAPAQQWVEMAGNSDTGRSVAKALLATRQAFQNVRSLLRQMGDAAGVPVEPPPQTALLDATMSMEGVLLAGVPGAGGYDAVFAITIGESTRERVEKAWSAQGVLALCVSEDPRGVQLEDGDPRQETVAKMSALKLES